MPGNIDRGGVFGLSARFPKAFMRTRKTKVTVETHQLLVVRRGNRVIEDWCTQCSQQVRMATADQAAVLAGVSLRTICRRVEAGKLHFKETGEGLLFICLNSLPK